MTQAVTSRGPMAFENSVLEQARLHRDQQRPTVSNRRRSSRPSMVAEALQMSARAIDGGSIDSLLRVRSIARTVGEFAGPGD